MRFWEWQNHMKPHTPTGLQRPDGYARKRQHNKRAEVLTSKASGNKRPRLTTNPSRKCNQDTFTFTGVLGRLLRARRRRSGSMPATKGDLTPRRSRSSVRREFGHPWPYRCREILEREYVEEDRTAVELAQDMACAPETVTYWASRFGLQKEADG